MPNPLKQYAVPDEESGNIYLISVFSTEENDWRIQVYENDQVTLIEEITPHEFNTIPERLRVTIMLEIKRAHANIAAMSS